MNAPLNTTADWTSIIALPSWALRWEAARDTIFAHSALMSIAAEAERKDRDVFAAAYDAGTARDQVEYKQAVDELERLFAEAAEEAEYNCDDFRTDPPSLGWHHPDSPSFGRAW